MTQNMASEMQGCERRRFSVPENQLVALLLARRFEADSGITTLDKRGTARMLSYAELYQEATQLCAGLQHAGLEAGDRVVLQLADARDVIVAFWGCILAGVVPVPLNTAPYYNRPNSQTDRLISALTRFRCRAVLAAPELYEPLSALLGTLDTVSSAVINLDNCHSVDLPPRIHAPNPDDAAAMFLTSGSTGEAKGIVQSHAAMLAMADATIQMNGFTRDDVTLNWMSLDHAGSLVFLGVMPLALGARQIHVPIDYVLKEPTRWLDLIDTWRASITWAPNFVFSLLLDRRAELPARSWDLTCMRFMVNAGEAVVSATARRFIALLQQFGLPDNALRPAFGMVETCSGITWSPGFNLQDTADSDMFVSLGPVIPGAAMKIVDEAGATLGEGQEGRLLLKGDSVFKGYEGEAQLNASVLIDGWLVTGDLAYIQAGQLYVTGREKDMVIINGNNHYCHEIEAVVARFPAVASDCVAATGVRAAGENTESLIIFYSPATDTADTADSVREALEKTLRAEVSRVTGIAPRAFVALLPEQFPRTEIGKIKRSVLKRRYESGELGSSPASAYAKRPYSFADESVEPGAYRELLVGITAIWSRTLKLDTVGLDETFFELGGSSLLAIQVQHELELLLEREVSMVELFDTPTIRTMAAHFSGWAAPTFAPVSAENGNAGAHAGGLRTGDSRTDSTGTDSTGADSSRTADIAVIGLACRFPGAHGPEAFWRVLEQGVETLTFFTPAEAIAAGVPPERAHDPAQVNVAPVLDDVEGCDIDFWKYAKREAELLDPQQRVFLETAWEAFEDAGYAPGAALGKVGVYAAAATNTYLQNNVYANSAWVQDNGGSLLTVNSLAGFNVMVANDKDYLPTRVSYKLDLTGPSMGIQTACSSTLVAVHEAARALRADECDMAIAGGCALMLPQHAGHYYEEGMINTPDGHCRAYDRDAKGTIFGSGSGAVLLKRLDRAQADGDAIYAVIKGSAVANDGGQKMGFTAPSMLGEYRAISQAIHNAGIDADSIGFIEGHGTGTPIGDPIEVQALTKAFRHSTARNSYCALGSVKTNIGHMGIASGIAGFIKTVLTLHHKTLPATLHFREANPAIAFDTTPFYVSNQTRSWEAGATPRRAGVNSLGIGGTNVHVILEEAPEQPRAAAEHGIYVLPVSAGSEAALVARKAALADWVTRHSHTPLADIAFTQQQGRAAMAYRQVLVCATRDELLLQLADASQSSRRAPARAPIVFMFTGQGSQYAGMGRELYATHATFRDAFDACAGLFAPHREHSLRDLVLNAPADADSAALLNQTLYTQPALFCIQVALVQLYRQLGIRPDLIVGHSIGEVAGVWAAGGLSLEDAVVLVEARSRLMQAVPQGGAMAAVKASAEDVRKLLRDAGNTCEIAACNAPLDTTLSGAADELAKACAYLQQHDMRVTQLNVSHAFHSGAMEVLQHSFAAAIANLTFKKTTVAVLSNADGAALDHASAGAAYWVAQLRAPVQFMQGLHSALDAGGACFVEIGPAPILCGFGRALESAAAVDWIPSLRKGHSDARVFANALATLFTLGHAIEWSRSAAFDGMRCHLPTYPWQRQRCWIEPDAQRSIAPLRDPLLARPVVLPRLGQHLYALDYSTATIPVLEQHRVFGVVVPPAALYVSQLLHTAADFSGQAQLALSDINFVTPMQLRAPARGSDSSAAEVKCVQIAYSTSAAATTIELSSQAADVRLSGAGAEQNAVQIHVTAELLPATAARAARVDLDAVRLRCSEALDPQLIEAHMAAMQVKLGESFLCFTSIKRGHNEALALLDVPRTPAARIAQGIPAGLIDCHWQTLLAALPALPTATIVPARIDTLIRQGGALPDQVWAHALIHQQSDSLVIASVSLLAPNGQVLMESRGIEFRAVSASLFQRTTMLAGLYSRRWAPLPSAAAASLVAVPDALCVAGNAEDVSVLASQLRSAGIEPLLYAAADTAARLTKRAQPVQLIYIDRIATDIDGIAACAALNRFLATLAPDSLVISQILVVTALSESGAATLAKANRAALAVQAAAAAHEVSHVAIRAVEIDEHASSLQALLALTRTSGNSGQRLRIKAGLVHALKAEHLAPTSAEIRFAADSVQVITGGFAGLGLLTAQWMFARGARRFLLASRSEPAPEATAVFAALRAQGATIELQRCDVSDYQQVCALAATAAQMAPVETLIHAAGVRRDGLIDSLQDADFVALHKAKAVGAVHLHEAFQKLAPRCTLYYSSVAAWLGAAGQSNYCAANAALDSLAGQFDKATGRVISVAWGPWRGIGMTAALNEAHLARIGNTGYGFLDAETGFGLLGRYLSSPLASEICIMTADTARLAALPGAAGLWPESNATGRKTASAAAHLPQTAGSGLPPLARDILALASAKAEEVLQDYLLALVTDMTSPSRQERVDADTGFLDMGVDSLAALEIRKKLESALALKLKSTLILDYPSIAAMARALVQQVQSSHQAQAPALPTAGAGASNSSPQRARSAADRADLLRELANEIDLQEQP